MKPRGSLKNGQRSGLKRTYAAALLGSFVAACVRADSYTSTTATTNWSTARWNNTADTSPYNSAFTANNAVSFTSGTYAFNTGIGQGNTINIGNVTLSSNVNVQFTGATVGTYATGGAVRTINVGAGAIYDLASQSISIAAGTGFIKSGMGIFKTAGNTYTGGFTLNDGTVILAGVSTMGRGALTINGGTIAADASRNVTARYTSVTIGGDFALGGVTTGVASGDAVATANITFADNMSLGAATRAITIGTNGVYTLNGVLSGTANTSGLTVAAASGATGRLVLGGLNTYTGTTTISSGTLYVNGGVAGTSSGTGTSPISVTGGTLGGSGNIGGTVSVSNNGTLLGGTGSTGTTLTTSNDLTLAAGSTIGLTLGASGAHSTLARSGGTWTFDAAQQFTLSGSPAVGTYDNVISGLAADPLSESSWTVTNNGYIASFTYDGDTGAGNIDLVITAVPEPATVLAGLLLVGTLGWHQRRQLFAARLRGACAV